MFILLFCLVLGAISGTFQAAEQVQHTAADPLQEYNALVISSEPCEPKILYSATLAFLRKLQILPAGPVRGGPSARMAVLQLSQHARDVLVENFITLCGDTSYMPAEGTLSLDDADVVRNALHTFVTTHYLKNRVTNSQAQRLVDGIKARMHRYQEPDEYSHDTRGCFFGWTKKDLLFPLVPGIAADSKPSPGYFPLSLTDYVEMGLFKPQKKYTFDSDNPFTFSGRQITSLDGLLAIANIRTVTHLNLGHNTLTSLSPEVLKHLPFLQWLNVGCNKLKKLPAGLFSNNEHLTWVSFVGNPLMQTEEEIRRVTGLPWNCALCVSEK